MAQKPETVIAQVKGSHLIVESLGDELVIFDRRTNKTHLLDAPAAAIYRAAENGCSLDKVAGFMKGASKEQKRAGARLGVLDLERAGLLISDMKPMPRRGLLKTLGGMAAAPLVTSLLAPAPAAAATSCCTVTVGTAVLDGSTCNPTSGQQISLLSGCTFNGLLFGDSSCTASSIPSNYPGPGTAVITSGAFSFTGKCT